MSVGEMSVGEMSVGEVSVGEMSVGEMSWIHIQVGVAGLGRYDLPVYTGESRVSILDFDLGGRARHPDGVTLVGSDSTFLKQ